MMRMPLPLWYGRKKNRNYIPWLRIESSEGIELCETKDFHGAAISCAVKIL